MDNAEPANYATLPPRSLCLPSSPTEAPSRTSRIELRVLYPLFCHGRPSNESSPTKSYPQGVGCKWQTDTVG